uniref:Uncharacterized protein n=1 Tax=Globodera rostochiensis TaxID=31243 RepID=A0A914I3D1_GLORO
MPSTAFQNAGGNDENSSAANEALGADDAAPFVELFTGTTSSSSSWSDEEEVHIHGMEEDRQQTENGAEHDGGSTNRPHSTGRPTQAAHHQPRREQSADAADSGPVYASSAPTLCAADENPTFLRHLWLPEEPEGAPWTANFVRKMDSLEACARLCRDNVEPFGGRHFACHGFTYIGQHNAHNACEFFDDQLAVALEKKPPLGSQRGRLWTDMAPQLPKNYFERICLSIPSRCARLPFAFDVHPRRALSIPQEAKPLAVGQVDDRKRCLQQCLNTKGCRSLDFDTANLTCTLYAHSLHAALGAPEESTWPLGQLVENADSDHYENTCLTELDRCGTRHLAFILIRNAELAGFSVGVGKMSASECLSRCLDSPPAFCRAVQFRAPGNECFLGTERPFEPLPSDELDIFEPVCLPDPPRTSILECHGEQVFERVPNMELRMDDEPEDAAGEQPQPEQVHGTDMSGLTLEHCLDACILDESCVSLIFRPGAMDDEKSSNGTGTGFVGGASLCRLFPFGKADNRTLSVIHPNVDFFELSCSRTPLPSAMRKMLTMPPPPPLPLAELMRMRAAHHMHTTIMPTTATTMAPTIASSTHAKTKSQPVDAKRGEMAAVAAGKNGAMSIVSNDANVATANNTTVMVEATTVVEVPPHNLGTSGVPSLPPIPVQTTQHPQKMLRTNSTRSILSEATLSSSATFSGSTPTSSTPARTTTPSSSLSTTSTRQIQHESITECSATMQKSVLLERERTLKLEQRQQRHVNVPDGLHCERLCADALAFRCRTFAYSHHSRDCLLSSSAITGKTAPEFELLSQVNPNFELYSLVGQKGNCGNKWSTMTTTTASSTAIPEHTFTNDFADADPPFSTNASAEVEQILFMATTTQNGSAVIKLAKEKIIETTTNTTLVQHQDSDVQPVAATPPAPTPTTTTAKLPSTEREAAVTKTAVVEKGGNPLMSTPSSNLSRTSSTSSTTTTTTTTMMMSSNPMSAGGSSWMAPPAPVSVDGNVLPTATGRIGVEQIRAGVLCDPKGLNVTFKLVGRVRYTGVVYAADRFAHCRLFVDEAAEFAFYVNRPENGQPNWCNSVEANDELNVVLVMSNDEVFPLDVTTSDDFFFYVSCDYRGITTASGTQRQRQNAWPGSVSGPEPGPLFASAARRPQKVGQHRRPLADAEPSSQRRERVHLKILRDGRPVSSVYIGERLSAVVEGTDVEVDRLRVADCNATRVGGRVPRPSSIPLLDRAGCSLNPHIIGHMRRHADRLEASLSAFRIDGSDQIDIVCSVLVCRTRCASREAQCPAELDPHDIAAGAAVAARVHRASAAIGGTGKIMLKESPADLPSVAGDFLTVDQRIRVLVSEEEERTLAVADAEAVEERQLPRGGGGNALPAAESDVSFVGATPTTTDILLGGMASTAASGDLCLNPVVLLFLLLLLLLTLASLIVSLFAHWCRRKSGRRLSHNFYPATSTFSTELSSHHFHIPRVLDRRSSYMG